MLTSMQNRYAEQLDYTPDQAELNRAMSLLRMNEQVRKTLNLCWLPMTAPWLIDQLSTGTALAAIGWAIR